MKHTLTLVAILAICSAMTMSCKNTKTTQPTPEEIQQQKQALADSVLADIDAAAEQLFDASSKSFRLSSIELTDEEKMIKPDYLLDPSVAGTLVTKSQKVNALVFYSVEQIIRKLYDMPCDEVKEVIAKLAAEVNFPTDIEFVTGEAPVSEKMRTLYEACKESGDPGLFWKFEYAFCQELNFLIVNNPDLFFKFISEEQWQAYVIRKQSRRAALNELALYDEELAQFKEFRENIRTSASDEERDEKNKTRESAKQYYISHKDKYIAKRSALLQ